MYDDDETERESEYQPPTFTDNMINSFRFVALCTATGAFSGHVHKVVHGEPDLSPSDPTPHIDANIGARAGAGVGLFLAGLNMLQQYYHLYQSRTRS
jgi:hypothetical protein